MPKRPLFCHHIKKTWSTVFEIWLPKTGHFFVMGIAQNIISLRSVGNCFAISSSAPLRSKKRGLLCVRLAFSPESADTLLVFYLRERSSSVCLSNYL
jgi:hypothetical protein